MRIFTTGALTILQTKAHLFRWPLRGTAQLRESSAGASDDRQDGTLLIDHTGRNRERRFAAHFDKKTVLDCAMLGDGRAAFLHQDQTLTWGPPPEGAWQQTAELSALPTEHPSWADGMNLGARRGGQPGGGFPSGAVLANRHGVGVACATSGNVALFRGDSPEPAVAFCLGTRKGERLHARPTEGGLLLTSVRTDGTTTLLKVDGGGALLAHCHHGGEDGSPPPALCAGALIVAFQGTDAVVRNSALEEVSRFDVALTPVAAAASHAGDHFALADAAGEIALFSIAHDGEIEAVGTLSYASLREEAEEAARKKAANLGYAPRRVPGSPAIGFAAKPTVSPPWTIPAGQFTLPLIVRSSGSRGEGVAVRLSGAALSGLSLSHASAGEETALFVEDGDGMIAKLSTVQLPEGLVLPYDPKPTTKQKPVAQRLLAETHIELAVHGEATGPSGQILRVEVSALGESSTPLKWMRPLTIESA